MKSDLGNCLNGGHKRRQLHSQGTCQLHLCWNEFRAKVTRLHLTAQAQWLIKPVIKETVFESLWYKLLGHGLQKRSSGLGNFSNGRHRRRQLHSQRTCLLCVPWNKFRAKVTRLPKMPRCLWPAPKPSWNVASPVDIFHQQGCLLGCGFLLCF